eukprot:1757636-Pyramimonas_sp.AAC.1
MPHCTPVSGGLNTGRPMARYFTKYFTKICHKDFVKYFVMYRAIGLPVLSPPGTGVRCGMGAISTRSKKACTSFK